MLIQGLLAAVADAESWAGYLGDLEAAVADLSVADLEVAVALALVAVLAIQAVVDLPAVDLPAADMAAVAVSAKADAVFSEGAAVACWAADTVRSLEAKVLVVIANFQMAAEAALVDVAEAALVDVVCCERSKVAGANFYVVWVA